MDTKAETPPDLNDVTKDFEELKSKLFYNLIMNMEPSYSEISDRFKRQYPNLKSEEYFAKFYEFLRTQEPTLLVRIFKALGTKGFFKDKNIENSSHIKVGASETIDSLEENIFILTNMGLINPLVERFKLEDYLKQNSDTKVSDNDKTYYMPVFSKNIRGFMSFSVKDKGIKKEVAQHIYDSGRKAFKELLELLRSKQDEVHEIEAMYLKNNNTYRRLIQSTAKKAG